MRLQADGHITLFDRFPQDIVRGINDGPKIKRNGYNGLFYNIENKIYSRFNNNKPDINIFLQIDHQTALSRKPDHDINILIKKEEVLNDIIDNYGVNFITIDATLPLQEVISEAKNNIWKKIS